LGGLSDASKPIRQACNRWLKQMSATDVGYVPNMRPDEQKAAIARWRKFWENKLK
jgi:hypothetical protein